MPDLSRTQTEPAIVTRRGIVTVKPATAEDEFEVEVPGFAERHVYQIRRWMPRGAALPEVADEVLIVFDDEGEPWVPAWWPG